MGGVALMVPTLTALLAVSLYPVLRSLWLSGRDTNLSQRSDKFIGLENYRHLWHDAQFWNAWRQTVGFTAASTLVETLLGLAMALVLSRVFRGRGFVRAVMLIPWAIPTVVSSRMFGWLFDGQNGVVNYLLVAAHLLGHPANFLGSTLLAMPTIVLADVWKTTPFMAVLILAGLQTIPRSLTEAAHIDGASARQTFWYVKLPLLMPSLLIAAVLRALDAFRIFDLPYTLTGGGPADSTETLSTLTYKRVFSGLEIGPGSSIATAMFITESVIAIGFAIFIFRRMQAIEH
ncbi:MAG: sugar ABC transporter permease [Mycobacterium sp.]|nr:sugar ABC transporter permease [Mycobacterium sp.]